jgi:transposase-like protein
LLAALTVVYPGIPVQRCWANKSRNVVTSVRKADREAVKADLPVIQYASGIREAQAAIGVFARRWNHAYPRAVACLRADEELVTFFRIKDSRGGPGYGPPMPLREGFGR